MSFSYVASAVPTYSSVSGTVMDANSALNVAAGDLLVVWCAWEDGASTVTVDDKDDDSNPFTMQDVQNDGSDYGCFGYVLSASAKASTTFRMTNGTARAYRQFIVFQFRPDSGDTVSLDQSNATGSGTGTAVQSGNITTTGDDEVVVGGAKGYSGGMATNTPQIGDANADRNVAIYTLYRAWYKLYTATQTDIHAQLAASVSTKWINHIISFKSAASAGGLSIPVAMSTHRRFRL